MLAYDIGIIITHRFSSGGGGVKLKGNTVVASVIKIIQWIHGYGFRFLVRGIHVIAVCDNRPTTTMGGGTREILTRDRLNPRELQRPALHLCSRPCHQHHRRCPRRPSPSTWNQLNVCVCVYIYIYICI